MDLVEHQYFYSIEGVFPPSVKAGFSKTTLDGINIEADISKVLFVLGEEIKFAYLKQPHSNKVYCVEQKGIYEGDGLFTAKESLALVVRSADCIPLFFYDETGGFVGIIHLGWRSAESNILEHIPISLKRTVVFAGVGLRGCCFQVGDFLKYGRLAPFIERKERALHYDPIEFSKLSLVKNGLDEDNFIDINICSFCDIRSFFSYRRNKTDKRTLSFIIKV